MDIRKDIIGNTPQIGDVIAFNPPAYKGLVFGEVISFSKSGLPEVCGDDYYAQNIGGGYSPKTGFAVIKKLE